MRFFQSRRWMSHALGLVLASGTSAATWAATPSVADALKLVPVQHDAEYDRPAEAQISACTLKAEQVANQTGWIVRGPTGQILRRFVDTNNDNVVDLWCYYASGLEVYRDIDRNHNGKADEYRWLNTGGSRWGLDPNEDGKIDSWKIISAEEVSAEVVRAVADRDGQRFARLLITPEEMNSIGLSSAQVESLSEKVKAAPERFRSQLFDSKGNAAVHTTAESKPRWVHFGGSVPGLVPEGTNGASKDILVYENVVAMIRTGEKHDQVPIGTMIQVGMSWRLIDAPPKPSEGQELAAAGGFFFPLAMTKTGDGATGGESTGDAKLQALMGDLEKLDNELRQAKTPEIQAQLNAKRADLVEQIALASSGDDRGLWLRQLADAVSAAVQAGEYPDGVERLKALMEKLHQDKADDDLVAYIEFRLLTADYGRQITARKADFGSIQKWWVESLEKFATTHPACADASEAMLQLAITQEFAGEEDEAKRWYQKIISAFSQSLAAKKAEGALTRLDCVGKTIQLSGTSIEGKSVNLTASRGKIVVVHYWATNYSPSLADMAQLKELLAKFKPNGFEIIGVNLDVQKADLMAYLRSNRVPWPILFEEGGLDSRLANSMGVMTLPTMLLIDRQGKVVNRNLHVNELDREIGALAR